MPQRFASASDGVLEVTQLSRGARDIVVLMATGVTLRSLNKTIDSIFKIVYLGFHEVKCSHHRKKIIEFRA